MNRAPTNIGNDPVTMTATLPASSASRQAAAPPRVRRPRWSDPRLLIGVVLAAVGAIGVTQVVAASDDTTALWMVSGDLARGTTITTADVVAAPVKLDDYRPYLGADEAIVGAITTRSFAAGELLTSAGTATADDAPTLRWVTLPVAVHRLPADLARGEQVDVYLVERTASGEPASAPTLVLEQATVADVDTGDSRFGGGSLELGVALAVEPEQVADLVDAEARGTVALVRVSIAGGG